MPIANQAFLATRVRGSSGAPQLATILGATPTNIGSTYGTFEETSASADAPINRTVRFRGNIFSLVNGKVYSTPASAPTTPTLVYTSANSLNTPNACWGLTVAVNPTTGVPTLYWFYNPNTSGQTVIVVASTNGTSFTETALTNGSFSLAGYPTNRTVWYHNQIHFIGNGFNSFYVDLSTMTLGVATSISGSLQYYDTDYCVFQGNLYRFFGFSSGGTLMGIQILVGSNWSLFCYLPVPNSGSWVVDVGNPVYPGTSTPILFAPGDGNMYLIALVYSSSAFNGWACWQITAGGTATDISATVLPTTLAPLSANNIQGTARAYVAQEMESVPGTLSTHIWLNSSNGMGATMSYWHWNGNSTLIGNSGTPNDSGVIGDFALAGPKFNGPDAGGYIFVSGSPEVYFEVNPIQGIDSEFLQFTGFGGGTKSFQVYYTETGEFEAANSTPMTLAAPSIISGPGATPTLNSNHTQIDNCSMDGTTVYQVQVTGLLGGVRANRAPRVF